MVTRIAIRSRRIYHDSTELGKLSPEFLVLTTQSLFCVVASYLEDDTTYDSDTYMVAYDYPANATETETDSFNFNGDSGSTSDTRSVDYPLGDISAVRSSACLYNCD